VGIADKVLKEVKDRGYYQ